LMLGTGFVMKPVLCKFNFLRVVFGTFGKIHTSTFFLNSSLVKYDKVGL
jgi:hypothetical protein